MRRAVFLDRDGTLAEEANYLASLDRLSLFPYAADAVRLLNRGGFAVVVITNQAGIARGIIREEFVGEVHEHIGRELAAGGARIDGFYYCPHHPHGIVEKYRGACDCRKPQPGMLRRAAADLDLDLASSFIVGDRLLDIEAGRAVGARGILVRTGYGRTDEARRDRRVEPDVVVDNLIGAVAWILRT
jgi:D-glycero-D-manno-heptose 1,7-bisphosphate phosphatase